MRVRKEVIGKENIRREIGKKFNLLDAVRIMNIDWVLVIGKYINCR